MRKNVYFELGSISPPSVYHRGKIRAIVLDLLGPIIVESEHLVGVERRSGARPSVLGEVAVEKFSQREDVGRVVENSMYNNEHALPAGVVSPRSRACPNG